MCHLLLVSYLGCWVLKLMIPQYRLCHENTMVSHLSWHSTLLPFPAWGTRPPSTFTNLLNHLVYCVSHATENKSPQLQNHINFLPLYHQMGFARHRARGEFMCQWFTETRFRETPVRKWGRQDGAEVKTWFPLKSALRLIPQDLWSENNSTEFSTLRQGSQIFVLSHQSAIGYKASLGGVGIHHLGVFWFFQQRAVYPGRVQWGARQPVSPAAQDWGHQSSQGDLGMVRTAAPTASKPTTLPTSVIFLSLLSSSMSPTLGHRPNYQCELSPQHSLHG